jgi:RimJ/RimL family protein N-acetyltransferase
MAEKLTAGLLDLRVFTVNDVIELHAIFSDPATHTIGDGPVSDIERTREWLQRRDQRRRTHGVAWYGVRLDGRLIGTAGLFVGRTDPEPEFGFEIGVEQQGRG